MKKEEIKATANEEVRTAKWELFDQVETATADLELIPTVIQTVIDAFSLDNVKLTADEKLSIMMGYKKIFSVLRLTQISIWDTLEKLDEIGKAEISGNQQK